MTAHLQTPGRRAQLPGGRVRSRRPELCRGVAPRPGSPWPRRAALSPHAAGSPLSCLQSLLRAISKYNLVLAPRKLIKK